MKKEVIIKSMLVTVILLLFLFTILSGEEFHLRDGTIIRGTIIEHESSAEILVINNEIFGRMEINRKNLKYKGKNYNKGTMLSFTQMTAEKNDSFKKGPLFSISFAGAYDEKISTCFDISYCYREFEKDSTRKCLDYSEAFESSSIIDTANYKYASHFIMPAIVMRLNILPTFVQNFMNKVHLFPYVGFGGGYGLAIINYTRNDTTSLTNEGSEVDEKDIDYKPHYYGGFHYRGLLGLSYKISSKATLVGEFTYLNANFKQFLTNDEKVAKFAEESFGFDGPSYSIGIRFGLF